MKTNWKHNFVEHWKYYTVPARASPSDLEFIKKTILSKGKDVKVLVLGSTPEYRQLCGELKIPVWLLDFSKENYEYLANEVKERPEENFIPGNWLDTDVPIKFDIILGDNAINMISKDEALKMFENVSKMLKPDGLFMPRTYIRLRGASITPEKAIEEYRKTNFPIYAGLMDNLYLAGTDFEKDEWIMKNIWKLIDDLHTKELLTDEEFSELSKLGLKDRDFHFYMPIIEDLEAQLKHYFEIVEVFYGTEPYLKATIPLHVLKRK